MTTVKIVNAIYCYMNARHKIESANITVIETKNKETNIMRKLQHKTYQATRSFTGIILLSRNQSRAQQKEVKKQKRVK